MSANGRYAFGMPDSETDPRDFRPASPAREDLASRSAPASRRSFFVSLAASGAAAATAGLATGVARGAGAFDPAESAAGAGPTAIPSQVTDATIAEAEKLAGISFTPAERAQIARSVGDHAELFRARAAFGPLDNQLAPAQVFRVLLPGEQPRVRSSAAVVRANRKGKPAPDGDADLDFATVEQLAAWMKDGKVTSRRLVARSLARLTKANEKLANVITLIEGPAYREADERDAELKKGKARGPLHGIPYGLKDLFDTAGIKTTWGAEPWRDRVPQGDATVVRRLREAGAICVAKTAVGALAYGDIWFGGTCRNPWNPEQGSSGSSAGSASAVAAGCVPFAIGTETLGSIVSPCTRCGATGLRPTFGRVPREGAMALCWSWDKVGPITRSVIDTGLVLAALHGESPLDPSSVSVPFAAPRIADAKGVRLGYDPSWFDGPLAAHRDVLEAARACGATLVERTITPPADPSILVTSLMAEAAAAFEHMTRTDADDQLSWQADEAWPNSFRKTWFVPAIELVQAERLRRVCMQWMRTALDGVDALILPPYAGGMLVLTNATGHPTLCLRSGFDAANAPRSITLIGHPFDEATLLSTGAALEAQLGVAERQPDMSWM
jgi:Asp-tRNA(Asn)/Glu-tRNA(Gln) amidotransferase A subunit family amidase